MAGGPIIGLMKSVGESSSNQHQVIVHQENFVDPDDRSVHTEQRQSSSTSYNLFGAFLACVTQQYPV
jgi:hypothetical protein